MEYKKLAKADGGTSYLWKTSLVFSLISFLLCGGFIYKIYDLQVQIVQLESKYLDLKEDFRQILNQSDGFQWTAGSLPWDYLENDYAYDDYPDFRIIPHLKDIIKKDTVEDGINGEKLRLKRELLGRTLDGVPVNSESYEDARKKNKTKMPSTAPPGIYVRQSRAMRVEDKTKAFRRIIKRPILKSASLVSEDDRARQIPHRRRHRQRRVENLSEERFSRLRPAIHLSGDVYVSNGWAHHEAEHYKNWSRESWVRALGMDRYFLLENGYLRISEPGLYLVYAQVLYFDEHDTNGFYVYKNDEIILQCTTTSHSSHHVRKSNTCYTAGINHLNEGDRLRVHDIESYRYSIFRPGKSFFGAIKLSDVRRPYE